MIKRDQEIDVTAGDTRMVILLHEKNGRKFLWPVLRLKPSDSNAEGILGGWSMCSSLYTVHGLHYLYDFTSDQQYMESVFAPSCSG